MSRAFPATVRFEVSELDMCADVLEKLGCKEALAAVVALRMAPKDATHFEEIFKSMKETYGD